MKSFDPDARLLAGASLHVALGCCIVNRLHLRIYTFAHLHIAEHLQLHLCLARSDGHLRHADAQEISLHLWRCLCIISIHLLLYVRISLHISTLHTSCTFVWMGAKDILVWMRKRYLCISVGA